MIRPWVVPMISLLALGASGCALLPESYRPKLESVTPRIAGIDLSGVDLVFDLGVRNPYPVSIQTPRYRYALAIEGEPFLSNEAASASHLPAREVGILSVPVRVSYRELMNALTGVAGTNEAAYKLDGVLMFKAMGQPLELPFEHEGTFPVLKMPRISSIDVRPSRVTLSGARLDVEANVTNPNIFDIGIQGLGYVLKIGEVEIGGLTATTLETLTAGASGRLNLSGRVSGRDVLRALTAGGQLGALRIAPVGLIDTPYGKVNLRPE